MNNKRFHIHLYYRVRPCIPRSIWVFFRRLLVKYQLKKSSHVWPIDPKSGKRPLEFTAWPENKEIAFVLNHDVDTQVGHDNCRNLMNLEMELGFRSTFLFVPERYNLSIELIKELKDNGFGVGVHGLKHDGNLFQSRKRFSKRAKKINSYLKSWQTKGFSSPAMHHNFNWMHKLEIDYATSSFDTDPFEPQPQGVCSIFPILIQGENNHQYVELPYTLAQDFTLFVLLNKKNTDIWKSKLKWIVENGGMALLNSHPDYMGFDNTRLGNEQYDYRFYRDFLIHVKCAYHNKYWPVLAKDIAEFWRQIPATRRECA